MRPWMSPKQLRRARERMGLSRDELARALGVTRQTIWNWEEKKVQMPNRLLENAWRGMRLSRQGEKTVWEEWTKLRRQAAALGVDAQIDFTLTALEAIRREPNKARAISSAVLGEEL